MNECLRSHNNISQGLCLVLLTNKTCLEQCLEHSRSLEYSFCSLWEGGREGRREREREKNSSFPKGEEAVCTTYFHHPAHEFFMENL